MSRLIAAGAVALAAGVAAAADRDFHSFANPEHIRVRHVALDLQVRFPERVIHGIATLTVERTSRDKSRPLILDTRSLTIDKAEVSTDGQTFAPAVFALGDGTPVLGQPLTITLPEAVTAVRITYRTSPQATALQWLTPAQTAGKKHPFLFTQSQAIDARSWIPLQDSPAVRVTYSARVRTPTDLLAVMSAAGNPTGKPTGDTTFEMTEPIPPYLIALAVGDLRFRELGPRTGVYAEAPVVARAAAEFADVEAMMDACEALYGPYRWGRYDVLVMPPSFPYGGMENPRLTFLSPTLLAGDKSLVSTLAHELAHSWSGNLVSNATWADFWLNEGFTVYLERRILEKVYGPERAAVDAQLGRRSLEREMAAMPKPDQILRIDLTGRPPIDGLTDVPYEKGALFLRHLEAVVGRERFDAFLKGYFDHFAFQSITTPTFAAYLTKHLLNGDPAEAKRANVAAWLHDPGMPADAPQPSTDTLAAVETHATAFATGQISATELPATDWPPLAWVHFLNTIPDDLGAKPMAALDTRFHLSDSMNSEVIFAWLLLAVKNDYEPAYPRLKTFLTDQGRRKFLMPLYEALAKTSAGKERAKAIYETARAGYHPVSVETVDAILGWDGKD